MFEGKNIFSQITSFVPWYEFDKYVKKYTENYRVRNFKCIDHFLSKFADGNKVSDINKLLKNKEYKYKSKDLMLFFLLTRYWISQSYMTNSNWLYNFFKKSLDKKLYFDFYEPIDDEDKYINHILNTAIENCVFERDSITSLTMPESPLFLKRAKDEILEFRATQNLHKNQNADKTNDYINRKIIKNKYPKWFIKSLCAFVPSKKNRKNLRKYIKV